MAISTVSLPTAPEPVGRHRSFRRWLEYLLLIAVAGLFLQRGFFPGWRTLNTDFPDYYLAARLYRDGYSLDRVYEWQWLQRQKNRLGLDQALVGYAPNPPLCFMAVLPLAGLPALAAKRCWLVLNLFLLAAVITLLRSMTRLHWRHIAVLVLLAVVPLGNNFVLGQMYVLILFLMTLSLYFWLRSRIGVSALLLAAAAALKLYPAVFFLYFVRKKQWAAAGVLLFGIAVSVAGAILLLGYEPVRAFGAEVLPRAMRGEVLGPYDLRVNSVTVLLRHLLIREPELNPAPIAHLPWAYSILQPLCLSLLVSLVLSMLAGSRRDPQREKIEWSFFTALLLLLSPTTATYHYVVLIAPAVLVIDHALQVERRVGIALVAAYVLVCIPIPRSATLAWPAVINMPRLWGTLAFTVLVGVLIRRSFELRTALFSKNRAAGFVLALIVFGLPGILSNWQSRTGQSPPGELIPGHSGWMAADPVVTENRILFTAMVQQGYVVESLQDGALSRLPLSADVFHPVATPVAGDAWVELSGRGSRIARFSLSEGRLRSIDVENGEQPVVSPDGRWLAFLRETAGRSALWIRSLTTTPGLPRTEMRVTPPSYDVLEPAFMADSTLVFSARGPEGPALFRIDPRSPATIPRVWIRGPVRYPAASPDAAWLVFSRRQQGSWHLWSRNLATGLEIKLTQGGCNSVSPSWTPDSKQIVYATDCGHGLGLTTLRRFKVDW
ncbi:MAG: glycosyltransferase 87 family protein [Acidobacteriia bacterium]|nr:glycosyltransferase 87 family protein [Terriglobia bacterium]